MGKDFRGFFLVEFGVFSGDYVDGGSRERFLGVEDGNSSDAVVLVWRAMQTADCAVLARSDEEPREHIARTIEYGIHVAVF